MKRLIKKASKLTLYHGTSFTKLKSIISQGLVPQATSAWSENGDTIDQYGGYIYLGPFDHAATYASSGNHVDPWDPLIVLEVEVDTEKLFPDNMHDPNAKTWEDSLASVGEVRHEGEISPNQILKINFLNADEELVFSSTISEDWETQLEEREDEFDV